MSYPDLDALHAESANDFNLQMHPHRRFNPLLGDWILVSPHRTARPWQGKSETLQLPEQVDYDPDCYLCPGNTRSNGAVNPNYNGVFVFVNDFSALIPNIPDGFFSKGNILLAESESGICKVLCYSPSHSVTMPLMDISQIESVISAWKHEYDIIGSINNINYVQIFENRGQIMGCSNPHPHGQIWANHTIPPIPMQETLSQQSYLEENGRCLLCDYLKIEAEEPLRRVMENDSYEVIVPFWAVWPYETIILPKAHITSLNDMNSKQRLDLARILKNLGICYDNLFQTPFPYSMGLHQAPTDGREHREWHLHFHFYPPLLRSANVKKFMVGYELLASPQRDITAESAASILRDLPREHYSFSG